MDISLTNGTVKQGFKNPFPKFDGKNLMLFVFISILALAQIFEYFYNSDNLLTKQITDYDTKDVMTLMMLFVIILKEYFYAFLKKD